MALLPPGEHDESNKAVPMAKSAMNKEDDSFFILVLLDVCFIGKCSSGPDDKAELPFQTC